uniref:Uncharacterized protein n=1 Tax=Panagrolaimus sp. ES5 TaxID=591445 RepID=A0AC34G2D5_9BILA
MQENKPSEIPKKRRKTGRTSSAANTVGEDENHEDDEVCTNLIRASNAYKSKCLEMDKLKAKLKSEQINAEKMKQENDELIKSLTEKDKQIGELQKHVDQKDRAILEKVEAIARSQRLEKQLEEMTKKFETEQTEHQKCQQDLNKISDSVISVLPICEKYSKEQKSSAFGIPLQHLPLRNEPYQINHQATPINPISILQQQMPRPLTYTSRESQPQPQKNVPPRPHQHHQQQPTIPSIIIPRSAIVPAEG